MDTDDRTATMLVAAFLYCEDVPQNEIARVLCTSAASVSRLLERARNENVLVVTPRVIREAVPEESLDRAENQLYGVRIREPLLAYARDHGSPLSRVAVFPGETDNSCSLEVSRRELSRFAMSAAPDVLRLLENAEAIGLTWGNTLRAVIRAMRRLSPLRVPDMPRIVFPTTGEPLSMEVTEASSSELAKRLTEILNGTDHLGCPSLSGIPAIIPRKFLSRTNQDQLTTIRSFIRDMKPYREIFGPRRRGGQSTPLIDRMDCLLTSLGRSDKPVSMPEGEMVETAGFDQEKLQQSVLTDLGGVLVPQAGLKKREKKPLEDFAKLWTGIKESHLEQCAERARDQDGSPGVVLIATTESKCDGVMECIRKGWVNTLLIDGGLSRGIGKRLGLRVEKGASGELRTS